MTGGLAMAFDGFMSGTLSCEPVGRQIFAFIYIPVCNYFGIGYWLGKGRAEGGVLVLGDVSWNPGGRLDSPLLASPGRFCSSAYKHFCALDTGCAWSIRIHEAAFYSCATFSSFIAFSGPSARSTSLFSFPSTCPSGRACTPGRFEPLSFCFLTFFCDGG